VNTGGGWHKSKSGGVRWQRALAPLDTVQSSGGSAIQNGHIVWHAGREIECQYEFFKFVGYPGAYVHRLADECTRPMFVVLNYSCWFRYRGIYYSYIPQYRGIPRNIKKPRNEILFPIVNNHKLLWNFS
jgi:hypothetical protein